MLTVMLILAAFAVVLAVLALVMQAWRMADARMENAGWAQLRSGPHGMPKVFDPAMVQNLPDAARRYFLFTIAPGTPLHTVSEIRMRGEFGLGSREAPGYMPMQARQILAPPRGFIWRLEAGSGLKRISGSDGMVGERSWTRFWISRLVPIRAGGDENHLRSSFGRVVAESIFWAPAALLPGNGVQWMRGETPNRARAIVARGTLTQEVEIEVAHDGRPLWVAMPRWSKANPEKRWRAQPFGGTLAEFRRFGGYNLPTRVDGGNHFGTADYFPFFRAQVEEVSFPD